MEPNDIEFIRRLDQLLDAERDALVQGDVEILNGIVQEKTELIDKLSEIELQASENLQPVNDKVRRNQAMLEQALQGIRSVAKRLSELRETRSSFDTYNQMGQKSSIESENKQTVEKRA
ncbi:MAG: flagellar export chaperone FlgN [Paracoccaceae bacterium]